MIFMLCVVLCDSQDSSKHGWQYHRALLQWGCICTKHRVSGRMLSGYAHRNLTAALLRHVIGLTKAFYQPVRKQQQRWIKQST